MNLRYNTLLLLALVSVSAISSCKKKEPETCGYRGTIVLTCTDPNIQYEHGVTMDGEYLRDFNGGDQAFYERDTGWHRIQVGGHMPVTDSVYLNACQTLEFSFE